MAARRERHGVDVMAGRRGIRAVAPLRDLRLVLLGAAAWAGGLAGPAVPGHRLVVLGLGGVLVTLVVVAVRLPPHRATALAAAMMLAGAAGVAALEADRVAHNPVAELAGRGVAATVVGTVSDDPRPVVEQHGTGELVRLGVRTVTGQGTTYRLRAPVLVLGDERWADVPLGSTVRARGELSPADDASGMLFAGGAPEVLAPPGPWWRASSVVRAAIRGAVAGRPLTQRALVPALVDGDVTEVPRDVSADFKTTGLTHLLAVSGTNLTLVVGFLLVVARWCRVRGRGLYAVGALGIAGFVLLARTEPSVLRAAVMGAIGLVAMGHDGRHRGLRGLGGATVGLLLVDPGLARSAGFALSVLATAGILLLGPPWRDALSRWLPRWLAEAIAVPAAAQLACTPVIAVISGKVSLVAVVANLLAEPAVGPATVLGLLGGLLHLLWAPLGPLAGVPAAWSVSWIVAVAHRCARLPTAQVGWGSGPVAIGLLVLLTVAIGLHGPRLLRHRVLGPASCLLLVAVTAIRLPTPGWW